MQKAALVFLAFAVSTCVYPVQDALADGTAVVRPIKKSKPIYRVPKCPRDRCGFPIACPDGTCYSLYGAYGPYGGFHYWSRYSYGGWGHRW